MRRKNIKAIPPKEEDRMEEQEDEDLSNNSKYPGLFQKKVGKITVYLF